MTVQTQDSVQYYEGPISVGTELSITEFTFIDNSHVSLKIRGVDGVWEYGTDYTVDGADTLVRTVTLNREVEDGQVLAVYLDVPITQNISPEEGGNFPASTNEFVLDKLTYICQMLYERIIRALQVSIDTPFNGTLSVLAPSKAIKINAAGDGLELSEYDPDTALETTKEYMESAQTAASNALTSQIAANSSETAATQQANLATQQANIATQQANLATQQANIATQQATIATNKASEVVVSGNEALSNIDTAKNNAITSITNQETTSRNVLIDEGATQIGLIQNEGATQVANVQSTGFYMRDDKLYYINSQGEETEFKSGGSGLEVCDIGMSLYVDETKGLRRYLNGQIVDINTNTQAFLNRLQEITTLHPSLLCTEEEWQTTKTMSAFGQVGKFVFNYSGDEVVSVRIPAIVNVQGLFDLQNLGLTVEAGLPNINAEVHATRLNFGPNATATGAFSLSLKGGGEFGNNGYAPNLDTLSFNASNSNSIYGKSNTVQPEAIQYPYFIQIATGSETENNIVNDIELNNPYSLFDSKYSNHELNNLSWLKSEGQWNAKAVYPTAYDKLLKVYNGTETVEGLSVKLSTESYTDYDFVINTSDETFRLPLKTKQKFYDATAPVVGNGVAIGFTNGSDNVGLYRSHALGLNTLTSAYGLNVGVSVTDSSESASSKTYGLTTDPTKSGIETHLTEATLYLYYYVGETVQNANLIDAGRIGELVATKTDMLQASGAGMPSDKYIDLTLGASGSTYTAPANGQIFFKGASNASNQYANIEVYGQSRYRVLETQVPYGAGLATLIIDVNKGDTFKVHYSIGGQIYDFLFIYARGSESEAS